MRATVLLLLLALATAGGAAAQDPVRVWATLSDDDVAVGETVTLELHIETSGASPESIEPPTLPDEIDLVGTRDYTQLRYSMPGGRTRLVRRELVLRPVASGSYRIPPFTVTIQGRTYRTSSLTLGVSAATGRGQSTPGAGAQGTPGAGQGARPGRFGNPWPGVVSRAEPENPARGPDDEVLFSSVLLPDTVYVGQQLTLRSEVLVSERAQFRLRRAPEYVPPNAPGFWVHDLAGGRGVSTPYNIGGRAYVGRTLERAYFPLTPGSYTIEPARLRYEIRRGMLYTPQSEELVSDSLRVEVLPVPMDGRPAGFTGAVGRFDIRARLEPTEVPAGEAVALTVEVEGDGNIKALPPPQLPRIAGVRVHPPSEDSEVLARDGMVHGVKRFTWVLVPEQPGRVEMPPIEYAYFDPETHSFDVARVKLSALTVRPGTTITEESEVTSDIAALKPGPARPSPLRWVRTPWFAALQFLPLLGMIWVLFRRRRPREEKIPSRRAQRRRLRSELDRLRRHAAGDSAAFCRELEGIVRDELAASTGRPEARRAGADRIRELLEESGVPGETAEAASRLLEHLAAARFAPRPPATAERVALADDAERLLDAIDREARSASRSAGSAALGLALVLAASTPASAVVLTTNTPAPGFTVELEDAAALDREETTPADAFARGTAAFAEGDFSAAADAFTAFVDAVPDDPHGWYNLGSAHYRAGERGRAVWAWLHALKRSPRDRDARHNLEVAGADPWLVRRATPILPLRTEEFLLLAGIAWLIGAGAGVWFLRRRQKGGVTAVAGVAAACALVASWGAGSIRSTTGVVLPDVLSLQAAPTVRAESLRMLDAATGVLLVERRGEWLRVRLTDGGEGWVEAADVGEL